MTLPGGYQAAEVDASCCGMAGAFGYEEEHYDISMKMGERRLFPEMRAAAEDAILVASGTSCRHQIEDGTGKKALHPAQVLQQALARAGVGLVQDVADIIEDRVGCELESERVVTDGDRQVETLRFQARAAAQSPLAHGNREVGNRFFRTQIAELFAEELADAVAHRVQSAHAVPQFARNLVDDHDLRIGAR